MNYHLRYNTRASARIHCGWGYFFWFVFRALPTVVATVLAILLLTISPAKSEALTPNDVEAGQMLFSTEEPGHFEAALIQSGQVHFEISGMLATVSLEQRFKNTSDRWVEGIYAFPLPDDSAVRHMEMVVGERRIVGKIREKSVARKIYRQAKKSGRKASLVEQQRPNLFTNEVANIGPGEEILIRLEYVQALEYSQGQFSLRFPMTITPRYIPAGFYPNKAATPHKALAVDRSLGWVLPSGKSGPHNRMAITARLDMGMPLAQIDASYHQITLARKKGVYDIKLADGSSEMDRDFVLRWKPVTGRAPTAAIFTEKVEGENYGLLMLLPPDLTPSPEEDVLAREMVFVIDTSGSMGGESIEQARQSLLMALAQLRPQDSFNIIEFNSQHRSVFRHSQPANRHYLQKAGEFVRTLSANGGTEMLPALQAALAVPLGGSNVDLESKKAGRVRQIIFITDGAIGNEDQLFEEIVARLGNSRLFTVGIGSAPNSWFMRQAAKFGRGTHIHIGSPAEVTDKMALLFEQISAPLVVDIQVSWPGDVESYPRRVPDLFQGQPLTVAFKFDAALVAKEIEVSGQMADKAWSRILKLQGSSGSGIASVWAREKIAALLDQNLMSKNEDEEQLRSNVLKVALRHGLMSPYTSFVAVEERPSRPTDSALGNSKVANTQPKGQSNQVVAYPATATSGPVNFYLGTFFLFLVMMVYVMRRPEADDVSNSGE
jgi:Ca-activated chloride channel family protein